MYLLAEMETKDMLLLAAIVAATSLLLMRLRRYSRRQKKTRPGMVRTDRPKSEERGHHLGLPPKGMEWEVKMHETARDLSAQLDSKMSALGHLIRESDRAAARLETALEAAGGDVRPPGQAESLEAPANADSQPDSTSAAGHRASEEIYTLADYGFDTREIAHRVDIPIGEVELILRLRSRRKK